MRTKLILLFGFTSLIFFFVSLFLFSLLLRPKSDMQADRAAVVVQMRALSRFETASYTIEKIIDSKTEDGNVFKRFLFGDRILLIANGTVIAGFDFAGTEPDDIKISGKKIEVALGEPQILVSTLDNTKTKVYDRERGLLSGGNENFESEARARAEESIREAACDTGILDKASENARRQLISLFSSLGFSEIVIVIPRGSC